jgi:hypothetical protein
MKKIVFGILIVGVGVVWYGLLPTSKIKYTDTKQNSSIGVVSEKKIVTSQKKVSTSDKVMKSVSSKDMKTQKPVLEKSTSVQSDARKVSLMRAKERREARRRYQHERHQWRRKLNEALQQAKKDGDYSAYNMLKEMEPDKELFLK